MTKEITVFIPIGRFLLLAHNVLAGVYASQKRARSSSREAQGTNEWPEPYFTQVGAKYGKSTGSDGDKDYSRKFSIVDGRSNDMAFAFLLSEAEGTVNNLGGVSQNKGAKPTTIYIGMPNDDLKEFALIGKAYIEQYISFDLVTRLKAVRKQRDVYAGSKNHKP